MDKIRINDLLRMFNSAWLLLEEIENTNKDPLLQESIDKLFLQLHECSIFSQDQRKEIWLLRSEIGRNKNGQ